MTLLPDPSALLGGALIGAASVLLFIGAGRIAGISGIAYDIVRPGGRAWRLLFLLGLVGGGALAAHALGYGLPVVPADAPWLLILSGALVGFGTRMGNGCTSGHGVCGLARLSPRSLVSVLIFMAAGIATATLLRPVLA